MTFIQCKMINDMSRLAGKETEIVEITDRAIDSGINFKNYSSNSRLNEIFGYEKSI